ncbi:MAG: GNAT family N-acetyltransferase [Chloroflexi bacterium]|nr:GNAT family N-acetyltransferase [Chloroflexota bacterium]
MAVSVKEVVTNRDLKNFIEFPFNLYCGNPYWVPPLIGDEMNTLRRDRNPAFEYCQARYWLAYKAGKPAGRIAAISNQRHFEKWGQKYMRFGWIDFIDDAEVSASLLGEVERWAAEAGMEAVHGPLGFTNMDHSGMLVEGFDELATMATTYNHPYYPRHLENLGYIKHTDWVEYELAISPEPNETIARIASLSLRRYKLHLVETSDKNELLPHARDLFKLYNEEYRNLYSAVPLSEAQIEHAIRQYIGLISPRFVPVVLDDTGRMVAFGIVMPSLSRALQKARGRLFPFGFLYLLHALNRNDRADLYLVAVKGAYQGKGINAILMDHIHRLFIQMGIDRIETNPELEWNVDVQGQWKYYEKRQHKRRRAFIKHLARE